MEWNPDQYRQFAAERAQPFFDLLALVRPVEGGNVVDLGCGTGELTARLHTHTGASATTGIDSSESMLAKAKAHDADGLVFVQDDIGQFGAQGRFDVIFSNAALHWLPDHPDLFARLRAGLRAGGQLAVQMPANFDHPSHTAAAAVAGEEPFADALRDLGETPPPSVLAPVEYAQLLDRLGFSAQNVALRVYGHKLDSTASVVEWTKGTALLRYQSALPPELFDHFVDRYRDRLIEMVGDHAPYFFPFKRILLWGRVS